MSNMKSLFNLQLSLIANMLEGIVLLVHCPGLRPDRPDLRPDRPDLRKCHTLPKFQIAVSPELEGVERPDFCPE